MYPKIVEAAEFIKKTISTEPLVGMIAGTGLTSITDAMEIDERIPYSEIPHFPKATVPGHAGVLVCGRIAGKPTLAMQGRFHLYEGYTAKEITFPVRVMALLGAKFLFISSAAPS